MGGSKKKNVETDEEENDDNDNDDDDVVMKDHQQQQDQREEEAADDSATEEATSMKDPTESQGLLKDDSDDNDSDSDSDDSNSGGNRKKKKSASSSKKVSKAKAKPKKKASPLKSRRHSTSRRVGNRKSALEVDSDDDDGDEDSSDVYMEEEEVYYSSDEESVEKDETLKIQRILAVRSETRKRWKEICSKMQSSEVTDDKASKSSSSNNKDNKDNTIIEERFLVKWNILSYMHVSWETQHDLIDQCDNAKQYISTFFRKQDNGYLFTSDERKDGDYFDPGLVQIDRILEIVPPDGFDSKKDNKKMPTDWLGELAIQENIVEEHGIVLDNKTDPKAFESGAGRQFLMKWSSLNYNEMSYEFERDIILCDQHDALKEKLKDYYERTKKPTRKELQAQKKTAEDSKRRSYLLFGDNSRKSSAEEKEIDVKKYQEQLCDHVYLNGGSLRDYQAEGVTWFLANFINRRSCIMADEMGLGKTLQTAAFIHLLVEKMYQPGPFLICVPLSTLVHWQREFISWTGLNTIVYHGSAEDRKKIREHEFAFEKDRPDNPGWGVNSLYLKKCEPAKKGSAGYTQWMASVVITTPEMLVADDWTELSYVKWSVLVVDENNLNFNIRFLLTGTPIQNDVKEFWTLLNFIDPENYDDVDEFLEEYGDMKSKEKIDDLHEKIRPYILRRLKEDVEKSVPPKEETLIEVELTLSQKQYYRALYEKNVGFLHKNKKKALDGPSLNNLAMQLRKCCNHLFLLNGVEQDMRDKEKLPI
ncbi:SNF2_N-domain-containing protein [Fragilariopsis cylindrus CCMP1102]|uniref:SNF2_N-domain-containing protein n=1 Tax=Fragilariopsis cylindrus CCMP1102 TaxID=635003 RepID=A0A1E7EJA4_9STRA|nr:SNF2_N-domain-containing protein [Fragilariopsis cylindrus CCMP1102]|eukprot:OEU05979.1 SNF2_N-domain-containing protein [Fragilariopsis cylindrus CCMP1102]